MFHKLPVVLKCNIQFLNFSDVDDEEHVLPAFKKLVTLFWLFDQSGAFDLLQNSDEAMGMRAWDRTCFDRLQTLLREAASEEAMLSNDVQAADICATRRWMQAILWRASMSGAWKLSTSHQQATPLSHPIQIAKEFLETISSLPSAAVEAHGPAMASFLSVLILWLSYSRLRVLTSNISTNRSLKSTKLRGPSVTRCIPDSYCHVGLSIDPGMYSISCRRSSPPTAAEIEHSCHCCEHGSPRYQMKRARP